MRRRKPDEIPQQLQADPLAFLRMKLRGENVVLPDGRGEPFAVSRARRHDGFVRGFWKKTVHEINVAAAGNVAKQRTPRLRDFDLIPADLRDFQPGLCRETDDFTPKNSQPGGATVELVALVEQRLIPDANAEERSSGTDEIAARADHFLALERLQTIVERADTGQNRRPGIVQIGGTNGEANVRVEVTQRFVHAAQVARAIVNQSNHALTVVQIVESLSRK